MKRRQAFGGFAPREPRSRRKRAIALLAVAVASVMLWQTELGSLVLYPFTILATWFHEMGHGIAAMLTGRGFERLLIFPDGSGLAISPRPSDGYRVADGLIAASGPLGPAVAGALLIVTSRDANATRAALTVLGGALIAATAIWVRSPTGWLCLLPLGLGIILLARLAPPFWQGLAIQVLGVQACISAWRQFDYLFSSDAIIGGERLRSDTGAIADALLLPYWFWGASISVAIIALLWWSLRQALSR